MANRTRGDIGAIVSQSIPEEIISLHRERRVFILLDNSGEANDLPTAVLSAWYDSMKKFGMETDLVGYVSQDLEADFLHGRFCEDNEIQNPILFLYYHHFIKKLVSTQYGPAWYQEGGPSDCGSPDRIALCLMHKVRPERVRLALDLLQSGLWDRSIVSFGGLDEDEIRLDKFETRHGRRPRAALDTFLESNPPQELVELLPDLRGRKRVVHSGHDPLHDQKISSPDIVFNIPYELYSRTRFSIVSETEMKNRKYRITEKSVKPFAAGHSAVFLGNPFLLSYLRSLGFQTFGEIIDERYDEITSPMQRYKAAFSEIARLAAMSDRDWATAVAKVGDKIIQNREYFESGLAEHLYTIWDVPLAGKIKDRIAEVRQKH